MADKDYGALLDNDLQQRAAANAQGTVDVTPEAATAAIMRQRNGGAPAVLGMYTEGNGTGDLPRASYGSIPPPVARFTQDPARAAAVADDHQQLGIIAQASKDFSQPFKEAFKKASLGAQRWLSPVVTGPDETHGKGKEFPDRNDYTDWRNYVGLTEQGVGFRQWVAGSVEGAFAPVTGAVAATIGRPLASIVQPTAATGPWYDPQNFLHPDKQRLLSNDEATQFYGANIGGALFMGRRGGAPDIAPSAAGKVPPKPAGSVSPKGRFGLSEEGFVADTAGAPVVFTHPKDAAQWIIREGNVKSPDQLWEIENGTKEGTWVVKQRGLAEVEPTPPNPGTSATADRIYTQQAEVDASTLATTQDKIAASKVYSRDPALMQEYLAQSGFEDTVHVSPAALAEVWKTGERPFEDRQQEIIQAATLGRDVEIPMSEYLAQTAGKPYAEALNAGTRVRPEGVSVDEAKELPKPAKPTAFTANDAVDAAVVETAANHFSMGSIKQMLSAIPKEQHVEALTEAAESLQETINLINKALKETGKEPVSGLTGDGIKFVRTRYLENIEDRIESLIDALNKGEDTGFLFESVEKNIRKAREQNPEFFDTVATQWAKNFGTQRSVPVKEETAPQDDIAEYDYHNDIEGLEPTEREEGPAPGMIRVYNGGAVGAVGSNFTPHLDYAKEWAARGDGTVWYLNVPEEEIYPDGKEGFAPRQLQIEEERKAEAKRLDAGNKAAEVASFEEHIQDLEPDEKQVVAEAAPEITTAVVRAAKNQYLNAIFLDAKAAGMTETQLGLWSKKVQAAVEAAQAGMFKRLVAQLKKERGPEYKAEYAQQLALAEQALYTRPDIIATFYLRYNQAPNGAALETPPVKINKTDAVMAYGSAFVDNLPNDIWAKAGEGESPDTLAEDLGFDNGQQMLAAIRDFESAAKAVQLTPKTYLPRVAKAQATNAARAATGFDTSPEGIAAAAQEAMVNPKVEDLLVAELKQLAKEAGLPFDKAEVKRASEAAFGAMWVKDALNIRAHERAVSKLAREAEVFALKGKFQEGFQKKQQQLLNQLILKQAWEFQRESRKYQRQLDTWGGNANIAGMAQQYLDRIHLNMAAMQLRVPRFVDELARATNGTSNDDFAWHKSAEGVSIYTAETPSVPPPEQVVEAYREVMKMLQSLAHNGAAEKKVWNGFRDEEEDTLIEEMQAKAVALPNEKLPQGLGGNRNIVEYVSETGRRFDAFFATMHRVFGMLDNGDFNGPWTRTFMGGATEAANTVFILQRDIFDPISKDFKAKISARLQRAFGTVLADTPFKDPRTQFTTPLRVVRGDILPIIANMGTEANLQRLMAGYGIEDYNELFQFVDRHLTPEELAWMNDTWEVMDKRLFPMAEHNKRMLDGVGMHKEKATPVTFAAGEATGGYWPIKYDSTFRVGKPAQHAEADADDLFQHPFRRTTTKAGFEESRKSPGGALFLSLDGVLKSHLDEVFTRIAYGQFIRSAVRMMQKGDVQNIVRQKLGPEYLTNMMDWLEYLVSNKNAPTQAWQAVNSTLHTFRNNLQMTYIAGSLSVAAKQALGLVTTAGQMGLTDTIFGATEFTIKVLAGQAEKEIFSQSLELQRRMHSVDQNLSDIYDEMRSITKGTFGLEATKRAVANGMMNLIGYADRYFASGATWVGAKNQYLRRHLGDGRDPAVVEAEAKRYADQMVVKTQGSGARKDVSGARRTSNEFVRMYEIAYSYPEAFYNLQMEMLRDFKQGRWGNGLRKGTWFWIIAPLLTAYVGGDIPDKVKKALHHGDLGPMLSFMGWEAALSIPSTIPIVRDVTEYFERQHFGQYSEPANTPVARAAEAVQQATKKKSKHRIKDVAAVAGLTLGVPGAAQVGKTGQYVWDWVSGKHEPKTPVDAAQGVLTGTDK